MRALCAGVVVFLVTITLRGAAGNCELPDHAGMMLKIVDGTYNEPKTIQVSCYAGSLFDSPESGLMKYNRTCKSDNSWHRPEYKCVPIVCSPFPKLLNINSGGDLTPKLRNGSMYLFEAEVLVFCSPGFKTKSGLTAYTAQCKISAEWSLTEPCSEGTEDMMNNYLQYNIGGTVINLPYKAGFDDPQSQTYKDLADSFTRALVKPMSTQFGTLYVGAVDYVLSSESQGEYTGVAFKAVFQPTLQYDSELVRKETTAAFGKQKFLLTDPNDNTVGYQFANNLAVSGGAMKTSFYLTDSAVVALSVEGILVILMVIVLGTTCVVCRRHKAYFKKTWMKRPARF